MPSMISPQTSVKLTGGYGTAVFHMLAMAFTARLAVTTIAEPWR
jgi:hypothetical protein